MKEKTKSAIHAEACKIELTQGQFAIVDAEDYERISRHKWFAHKDRSGNYYARRGRKKSDGPGPITILMHREILNVPAGMETHHKNHVTLDNRKCNIEAVTVMQNQYAAVKTQRPTKSRYKGVRREIEDYADGGERWVARIGYGGTKHHLGVFRSEVMAAREYDRASREHHGRFSEPNFKEFVRRSDIAGRLEEARGRFFLMYVKLSNGPGYEWIACQYSKSEQERHPDGIGIFVRDIRQNKCVLVSKEKIPALKIGRRNVLVV